MAAAVTHAAHAQTEAGGSCKANTRRASGTASSRTSALAMVVTRAIRMSAGRPAMRARTHGPTAKTASAAAVRAAAVLTPGVDSAIA